MLLNTTSASLNACTAVFSRELVAGLDFVAPAPALLFFASDSLAAAGAHIRHVQHGGNRLFSPSKRVVQTGQRSSRSRRKRRRTAEALLAAALVQSARGRLEAKHLPFRALVIQDVVRARTRAARGSGTRDELALVARHPGAHGQSREVIAGQKSLTGKVAVGVEIAFFAVRVDLAAGGCAGVAPPAAGGVAPAARQDGAPAAGRSALRSIAAWPRGTARATGRRRDRNCRGASARTWLQPGVAEPAGVDASSRHRSQNAAHALAHLVAGCFGQLDRRQRHWRAAGVVLASVSMTCSMDWPSGSRTWASHTACKMRPHERLVGNVQARRTHAARHHVLAAMEEILVVAVEAPQ